MDQSKHPHPARRSVVVLQFAAALAGLLMHQACGGETADDLAGTSAPNAGASGSATAGSAGNQAGTGASSGQGGSGGSGGAGAAGAGGTEVFGQGGTEASGAGGSDAGAGGTEAGGSDAGTGGTESGGSGGSGEAGAGGSEPDPFDVMPTCTSNKKWTSKQENKQMKPGEACNACHSSQKFENPPIFSVAGTVFPTGHEPDLCYGLDGFQQTDVVVVVTEANGKEHTLPIGQTGNFSAIFPGFAKPYKAKVVSAKGERIMETEQTDGDCNGCHTQDGDGKNSGAPGRIIPP